MSFTITKEKQMATHSSTLAWKIPWMEEPGRLQSMGSWRVGHDRATSLSVLCIGEGNGNPLQCSCLENPRDRGAWWAAINGVAQSGMQMKLLSSSSRTIIKFTKKRCLDTKNMQKILLQRKIHFFELNTLMFMFLLTILSSFFSVPKI